MVGSSDYVEQRTDRSKEFEFDSCMEQILSKPYLPRSQISDY
jgi:hypothetical protein